MQPSDPHEHETGVSLRDHLETLMDAQQKRLDERWAAQQETLANATESLSEVMLRSEYDDKHAVLITRIEQLEQWRANLAGRAAAFTILGALLVATSAAIFARLLS